MSTTENNLNPEQQETVESRLVPGVGRVPFPAYRGTDPYVFVSYAHADSSRVFPLIKRFNDDGFNVWYDEGIAPGKEWSDAIANALSNCTAFVVMITPVSAPRENVNNEIEYALDDHKHFLAIHLEETDLTPGQRLRMGRKQAILKYNMTDEEFEYKYIEAFTSFGLRRNTGEKAPVTEVKIGCTAEVFDDSPEDAKKRTNGDLVRIDGFDIEHGLLRGYFGSEKNIKVPDEVRIIGSRSFDRCNLFVESIDLNQTGMIIPGPFGAFCNCPKLKEVRIPETVREVRPEMFRNCPELTLYVKKKQLSEGFESSFTGKGIVYLDE